MIKMLYLIFFHKLVEKCLRFGFSLQNFFCRLDLRSSFLFFQNPYIEYLFIGGVGALIWHLLH